MLQKFASEAKQGKIVRGITKKKLMELLEDVQEYIVELVKDIQQLGKAPEEVNELMNKEEVLFLS